jgi:hypothetical protein
LEGLEGRKILRKKRQEAAFLKCILLGFAFNLHITIASFLK